MEVCKEERLHMVVQSCDAMSARAKSEHVLDGDIKMTRLDVFVNRVDAECRLKTGDGGQTMLWLDSLHEGWKSLEEIKEDVKRLLCEAVDFWARETPE